MKKKLIVLALIFSVVYGCKKVPITGRRQLNLLPESQMMSLSATEYSKFLNENKPVAKTDPRSVQIERIGKKLSAAVTQYLAQNKMSDRIQGFKWEYTLVEDATMNAWCMPGGKIVFYTGILPVCQTDEGIAVVMGHEIAHAIARHGNERMSQGLVIQGAGATLDVLSSQKPDLTRNLLLQSYGIGSALGSLAFSRNQESEADKMGLVFMAMAGYDPKSAPSFWQRMKANAGAKPPEFLSTHPSDEKRIKELNAYMPEALKYYKKP
jgi:predicted Zn-dependent protease